MKKIAEQNFFIILTIKKIVFFKKIIRLIQNGRFTSFLKTNLNMFWRIMCLHTINTIYNIYIF
jgi:hypothetical protein